MEGGSEFEQTEAKSTQGSKKEDAEQPTMNTTDSFGSHHSIMEAQGKFRRFDYVPRGSILETIHSFSIVKAYDSICGTRAKPWDNRELDVFAGIQFFSFFFCTVASTGYCLMLAWLNNLFSVFGMMRMVSISSFLASNIAMEIFPFVSAFFTTYKCI